MIHPYLYPILIPPNPYQCPKWSLWANPCIYIIRGLFWISPQKGTQVFDLLMYYQMMIDIINFKNVKLVSEMVSLLSINKSSKEISREIKLFSEFANKCCFWWCLWTRWGWLLNFTIIGDLFLAQTMILPLGTFQYYNFPTSEEVRNENQNIHRSSVRFVPLWLRYCLQTWKGY